MNDLSPLNDDERAELIAYLDGELDDNAARTLEAKLSTNPKARAEADALRRTWELLDYLPRTEPSASFTQRTVSRISAVWPTRPMQAGRWRGWVGSLSWAAAVLLCGVAGYAAMTRIHPKEANEDELVRDLRVIENKRYYEAVGDIDFLHNLDDPDRFGEDSLGS